MKKSAAVQKADLAVSDHRARSETCSYCKRPVSQPQTGRHRKTCGSPRCNLARRRNIRAGKAARWDGTDWLEALALWKHRCSRCGREAKLTPKARLSVPVLPVCPTCKGKPIGVKAKRWLSRCTWGVPLPAPGRR